MPFGPDPSIAAQWQDLTIYQNKDADLTFYVADPLSITPSNPNGNPYNLTGLTMTLTVKANRLVADATGTSYSCTIQSPPTNGIATVTLPAANNTTVGEMWYRVDLIGSETKTVKFGRLIIYAV